MLIVHGCFIHFSVDSQGTLPLGLAYNRNASTLLTNVIVVGTTPCQRTGFTTETPLQPCSSH